MKLLKTVILSLSKSKFNEPLNKKFISLNLLKKILRSSCYKKIQIRTIQLLKKCFTGYITKGSNDFREIKQAVLDLNNKIIVLKII